MNLRSKIRTLSAGRKFFLSLLCGGLLFLIGFSSFFLVKNASSLHAELAYEKLCRNIFRDELSGNTLTLHYTLQNPSAYGIYYEKAKLPVYSAENQALSNEAVQNWLDELSAIDADKLSEQNRYSYQLLARYLKLQLQFADYPYYDEPLSPNSGMQQTLPILLSEYRFRKRKDIDDYLSLLSQMDDYYEGLLTYEKERTAAGLFMPPESVGTLNTQCRNFFPDKDLKSNSHFLIDSFAERLMEFQRQYPELLDEESFENYYQQNLLILREEVVPAYEKLSEEMTVLSESFYDANASKKEDTGRSYAGGLGATREGKAYYELLIRKSTGSYRPMEEIQELLYNQFTALRADLSQRKIQQAASSRNDALSVNEILNALQQDMKEDFPPLLSGSEEGSERGITKKLPPVTCEVKSISKSLSAYSAPAFYLTPPMDDFQKNIIYINPDSSLKGVSLFTTLAHESFPGHLYQTVYARESGIADRKNPLRGLLDYPGYCEGWALYVELQSYDYAANYYDIDPAVQKNLRSLELCLMALLDFHIHDQGMSLSQTEVFLSQFGIPADSAKDIYSYIVQEPANYLKYYLSYLEIAELKKEAMVLWKEDYSDLRFHRFYLDAGPSDFSSLSEKLKQTAIRPE